jgi:uncharacterized protein with HEPN domain
MQRERLYLLDILAATRDIERFVHDVEREAFLANSEKQSAVAFQFSVIGEAVFHVTDALKHRYPEVAWIQARDLRNLIAHRYFAIDWTIIWDTATISVPLLRQQISTILAAEFPEE